MAAATTLPTLCINCGHRRETGGAPGWYNSPSTTLYCTHLTKASAAAGMVFCRQPWTMDLPLFFVLKLDRLRRFFVPTKPGISKRSARTPFDSVIYSQRHSTACVNVPGNLSPSIILHLRMPAPSLAFLPTEEAAFGLSGIGGCAITATLHLFRKHSWIRCSREAT